MHVLLIGLSLAGPIVLSSGEIYRAQAHFAGEQHRARRGIGTSLRYCSEAPWPSRIASLSPRRPESRASARVLIFAGYVSGQREEHEQARGRDAGKIRNVHGVDLDCAGRLGAHGI